jgi:putative ABC transport system substrate-binding protein
MAVPFRPYSTPSDGKSGWRTGGTRLQVSSRRHLMTAKWHITEVPIVAGKVRSSGLSGLVQYVVESVVSKVALGPLSGCSFEIVRYLVLSLGMGMRRREFLGVLGGAAAAWPFPARAQQPSMPVIGFLGSASPDVYAVRLRAFGLGLKEEGYVERQNVAIEYRWAEGHNDRLPILAAELVHRRVTVIAAGGGAPSALAVKAATATIPIVFETAADPVALGLVTSLSRPGGNLTGVTNLNAEIGPKRLELLRELMPTATNVAVLVNPTNAALAEQFLRDLQAAAPALGMQLHVLHASTERDFSAVFSTLTQLRADALVIAPDQLFSFAAGQLAALALRHAMPTIYLYRAFVMAGGLMSYGADETESHRLLGMYVGKILKGDKPADLPVQQSTKVELYINLKTAKALGITVPLPLSGRADELIE